MQKLFQNGTYERIPKIVRFEEKETGKLIFYYWASSQKHKAIFSTREKAMDAARWLDFEYEIVEFV